MESTNADDVDENALDKVISIRNEASIIQETSSKLFKISQSFSSKNETANVLHSDTSNNNINNEASEKSNFQKQVETGEITPFQAIEKNTAKFKTAGIFKNTSQLLDLEKYLFQQAELARKKKLLKKKKSSNQEESHIPEKQAKKNEKVSEVHENKNYSKSSKFSKLRLALTRHKEDVDFYVNTPSSNDTNLTEIQQGSSTLNTIKDYFDASNVDDIHASSSFQKFHDCDDSGSEYVPSDEDFSDEEVKFISKKKSTSSKSKNIHIKKILDDGDEEIYYQRVKDSRCKKSMSSHKVDNLFKVPNCIWKNLYKYQQVSVQWLWELHGRSLGGLLGDEMGLGKTVQIIAFLASLDFSELLSDGGRFRGLGPTLIICPATLLEQWVKHFHDWWPIFRVILLHQSSTYQGEAEDLIESLKYGGILVTSYTGVLNHKVLLLKRQWHYVILDEGHKIRNPEAKVTQIIKKFSTPHRLLLTGSPMQNSLKELWSLFDFILPGKLGTLVAFMEHCANPITRGGYTNATPLQEATALQVATMLKNTIMPYMLRRTKFDVQHHVNLPEKNEQVLFCSLTEEQKTLYKRFLQSDDVSFVIHEKNEGKHFGSKLLVALTTLRKICNHPDLYLYAKQSDSDEDIELTEDFVDNFGYWKRSGKMTVVRSLLKIWKKQGHRVLLFTQSRQMIYILEALLQREKHTYLRMDGTTPMRQRQQTINKFNSNSSYFVFLLTTRVGGLGVNLTGANRVIIYDPDWNPATDAQARERAWRIGQDKNVTIYRLITAGTIEEKMYHRQIFKLLLSNRVLEDPRQRRLFRTSDLTELFNLNEPINGVASESDQLFHESRLNPLQSNFSPDKIKAMRKLASSLSKKISESSKKKNHGESKTEKYDAKLKNTPNELNKSNKEKQFDARTEKSNSKQCNVFNANYESAEKKSVNDKKKNKETETKKHKSHRNKRKKNKVNEVSALFEGERVFHLIGRRLGTSHEEEQSSNTDDHYVLSKLFSKAAVSSAFQHESVLLTAKDFNEKTPLERIAHETAQESMDFVRKSRKWCWMPSWDTTVDNDR